MKKMTQKSLDSNKRFLRDEFRFVKSNIDFYLKKIDELTLENSYDEFGSKHGLSEFNEMVLFLGHLTGKGMHMYCLNRSLGHYEKGSIKSSVVNLQSILNLLEQKGNMPR